MKRIALITCSCLFLLNFISPPALSDEALIRELADGIRVELRLSPSPHFILEGLEFGELNRAKEQVSVFVESSELKNPPAIIGEYDLAGNRLTFRPRFPFTPGVVYRVSIAETLLDQAADERLLQFSIPRPQHPTTPQIAAVYPSSDSLPENLLKFYIHFSQPMSRGEAYRRVHLLENGVEIPEPFLELTEELWNSDQTRFTLFIHPGRIKRGVQPRELQGPPLSDGRKYTLRIDHQWESAAGVAFDEDFTKEFTVTSAAHEIVDPLEWKLDIPAAGGRQPVSLRFNSPLDHAMLTRVLEVQFNDGSPIEGEIDVLEHETLWSFTPKAAWKVGAYNIEVATNLEDLCGNNLAAPFEVKLQNGATETPASKIAIEFIAK